MQRWAKSLDNPIRKGASTTCTGGMIFVYLSSMDNLKDYRKPDLRLIEVRFERALLQTSGTDRADDGYDPGIDLGDLD